MKNIIKHLKACLALITLFFFVSVAACSSDNEAVDPSVKIPDTILNSGLTFDKAGGTQTLSVQANVPIEVVSDQEWCIVTHKSTTAKGTHTYEVTMEANPGVDDRKAQITVLANKETIGSIPVSQTAADGLSVDEETPILVGAEGGTITVPIQINKEYTVDIKDSWITRSAQSRGLTTKEEMFIVKANRGAERIGTIAFTVGSVTKSVTVKQAAGGSGGITGGDAWAVAKSLGLGWNLGNQLDSHDKGVANETAWNNAAATQATFTKLAEAGFTSVRIPVTWLGHIGAAPDYTIAQDWLNRVAECVGYAENAGLNVIINIHHDGANSEYWLNIKEAAKNEATNTAIKNQLKAMWTQIATKFKNKGNFLVFEAMNEIHDGGWGWGDNRTDGGKQYAILNEWNQVFVDAVRAVGGENTNRYLGVPGYCTNIELTLNNFQLPDDPQHRLLVSVHFYDPTDFTLEAKYSDWGHTGESGKKADWGDEDNVKNAFSRLKAKFIDQGIPVYIGEMGCTSHGDARGEAFRKYYLEYVCKAAKDYGMVPFYWDNGGVGAGKETSGLINHSTGSYVNNGQEIIEVMTKAIFTEDASYTLESVYNSAPRF